MDWEKLSIRELLALARGVLRELRRRQVVRTDNAPLGDVAEYVVRAAYGGSLVPNSGKSYDLIASDGRKVQVKARSILNGSPGAQRFSPFRTFDFDVAVFLLFERDTMDLLRAVEADVSAVQDASTFRAHVNGYTVQVSKVLRDTAFGVDVGDEIASVYASI